MQSTPEHNKRCEQAVRPTCVCSTCGTSLHGWSGHLERARRGVEGVRELSGPAEEQWLEQRRRFQENRRQAPTRYLRRAGGAVGVAALVSWLAEHEGTVNRLEKFGNAIHRDVFGDGLGAFAAQQSDTDPAYAEYGREVTGHFWCALLAAIADALDRGADLLGKVPDEVGAAVREHGEAADWGRARIRLAEVALRLLWRSAQLLLGADLPSAVLHLRVFAVLICPDPGGHLRVARDCLRPLVRDTARDHLTAGMDPDWLWGDKP
ncbi:hypothetical protein ABZ249_00805 [Nocardiopsis sp. NPDC006139]|uniref:hypothetical protein n=1 Tax=unclassified Nocardiopsis TaxID=2649073 RepID=UPI0033B34C98